ncbi:MAG: hypothetical protein GOU98_03745 [Candidatus Altiarchaeota archaeon]|nr:hypothetical protein [Candidatus Altiarchaeota archaeon]
MLKGLDLHRLLKSINLNGVRLGKASRAGDIFVFETTGDTKFLIVRDGGFYPSNYAPRGQADGFSMYLRKHVSGKIIQNVTQYKIDRIIRIDFKDSSLIFELFGKFNIIYLENDKIVNSLRRSRSFRRGETYTPPESVNHLELSESEFEALVKGKEKKELARTLGLGKLIENIYGTPLEMRNKLIEMSNKPLTPSEVEVMFKEGDVSNFSDQKEAKLNAERIKISKSVDEAKHKVKKHEKNSKAYKEMGQLMMLNLPHYELLISSALKKGQKRIKVSPPKN